MRIVINDANILIDLYHLDLVDVFFELKDVALKTTDFVFEELQTEQKTIFEPLIQNKSFELLESNEEDLTQIFQILSSTSGLSVEDCSVWYHTKKCNGILLTGDSRLKKLSSADGVEVRGILYIFDLLLISGLLPFELGIEKINQLHAFNHRLPIDEKTKRIEFWKRFEHMP